MGENWTTVGHATLTDRVWRWDQEEQKRKQVESWQQEDRWPSAHKALLEGPDAKRFDNRLAKFDVLGSGAFGCVEKVSYRSVFLARKRIGRRGFKIDDLRQEGLNMRKLSHEHVVKLVGQYILPSRELCLLIWPAAVCTLGEFLDDLEHFRLGQADRDDILERFARLRLQDLRQVDPRPGASHQAVSPFTSCPLEFLRSIIGCTAKALAYCHEAKVRHNDIKPSNILLMPERVYLADFGVSRDVSGLDHTTTEGQPGTEKWRAPELYTGGKKSMQLADMYSLGLVYLNIATVLYNGKIDGFDAVLRYDPYQNRQQQLARREDLLSSYITRMSELALTNPPHKFTFAGQESVGPRPLLDLVRRMTSTTPKSRPEAHEVNAHLAFLGGVHQRYHGACCRRSEDWVVDEWNKKFVTMASENARQRKRIEELEGRDQTYERRLENERRKQEQHVTSLQKRLEEAEQRCRQLAQDSGRKTAGYHNSPSKRNSAMPVPKSANSGAVQPTVRPPGPVHRPPMQAKSQSAQQSLPANAVRVDHPNLRRIAPALRASTEPVTQRSLQALHANGIEQRRNSPSSRIPLPITPTRAGTPSTLRDQSSTDSSLASSIFSRRSVDTTPTPVVSVPDLIALRDDDTVVRARSPSVNHRKPNSALQHLDSWTSSTTPSSTPSVTSSQETPMMDMPIFGDMPKLRPAGVDWPKGASERLSWADVLRNVNNAAHISRVK